ncbi:MAG: spermine/spermidine synthase domain-containing protein [Planctomycetota bacterium]|jgi:SAM-dependent methyltransferase
MSWILAALSCLVLSLEVLETKIFAYSLDNTLIFLVVGVVLLGFGSGGSVLAMRKELGDCRSLVRRNLLLTAVLLIFAHWWFAIFSDQLNFSLNFASLSTLILLAAPYFTAGMAISAILAEPAGNVHLRYGMNLFGSALGCASLFFILGPLSGPECLVLLAGLCALLAVPLAVKRLQLSAIILALGIPAMIFADELLPYQIQSAQSGGQLALIEYNADRLVREREGIQRADIVERFDRWDPTARVQVHGLDAETTLDNINRDLAQLPSMWFTQDSSYGSPLIGRGENPEGVKRVYERTCYGVGYFRQRPERDVLIIGLGGAPDVQTALHHESRSITGVDINATAIEMVRGPMKEFLGDPYGDPRVELHIQDGRSFARSTERSFDLIQLSGVDTKSVLASGTLALNESYLYTLEAMGEYLDRLKPEGMLCILYAGEEFKHRLAVTAMTSLRDSGIEQPERHLMILQQSAIFCFLVKKTPFTDQECAQMDAWLKAADDGDGIPGDGRSTVVVMMYQLLSPGLSLVPAPQAVYIPDGRETEDKLMQAVQAGTMDRFIAEHPRDISPAPDWRPFFFNVDRVDQVWSKPPGHFQRMYRLLGIMMGMAVLLILVPLLRMGMHGLRSWSNLPFAIYFAALGAGYIMAMSGLIQRYVLFLGHQAFAFPVVIGGLLIAAAMGSMLSARFATRPGRAMSVAVIAICLSLGILHSSLDTLFSWTADFGQAGRIGISLALLLPLGIPLGMMFPIGLSLVKRQSPLFVPWAFGINGVFSVIGTSIVLPGAILFGFPTMAASAAAVYILAALIGLPLARRALAV